ncbi:hypothetical protein F0345_23140 [Streptomyces rutgersensis]|uniref:Uncharacterized protein n=1 Tax=Streptomyces rutgersensis TaxID=53451 RepID=A0ABX6RSN1_9ACTN|nr:hypothetical protein [Streptomyces rutgersensis]QNE83650.1 hypothetical protein F0345_23140 [Streptomyces rutgersensis]
MNQGIRVDPDAATALPDTLAGPDLEVTGSTRPIPSDPQPIPRTQNAVAAGLPPAQRMEFYREMGEATPETIGHVLTNWWLLVQVAGDPQTARTAAAVKARTASGRSASTVMRELRERGR